MNTRSFASCIGILTVLGLLAGCGGSSSAPSATINAPPIAVTAVIGVAGGTLTGPDGVQVIVPAGALNQSTTIGIARSSVGAPGTLPEDYSSSLPVYEFTPHDLVFNTPVTIRVPASGNSTSAEILMASPGGNWQVYDAAVSAGFAQWQRNSFSWGIGPFACAPSNSAPYSAGNPDPYPCSQPRGFATASATPTSTITRRTLGSDFGNSSGSAGSWEVNQAGTVRLAINYQAAPDCENPRARLLRWNLSVPLGTPGRVQTLFDGPVTLTPTTLTNPPANGGGSYVRGVGSTSQDVSFSHLDNGTSAFGYSLSCNRPFRTAQSGGDLLTFVAALPVPSATYAISGTVSGLTGTGLVLQSNGGDNRAVAADGAFNFATAIGAGTPYSVTVLTQPSGQTCGVQNGSGTANANVTNVAVSCVTGGTKVWQGAALLETLDAGDAFESQVSFDVNGNAMAIWSQISTAGGKFNIYSRRYVPNTGWGAVERIQITDTTLDYRVPQLAFGANGDAIAVFAGFRPGGSGIWTARYTAASSSWSTATQLAAIGTNPQIAIDTSSNAMVVWDAWNGNYNDIRAIRYDASTSAWQAARVLSADIGGTGPRIAFDASGNAIAIWENWDASNARYTVMADRYAAASGWNRQGLPTTIAVGSADRSHRLAVDAAGNAMAVWEQLDGAPNSIYASRYTGAGWGTPALVETSVDYAERASVSMDGSGNAMVVWSEVDNVDVTSIWARRYAAGVGGTAVRIDDLSTYTSGGLPQIAMDAAGNGMAVWRQGSFTWANRYVAATGWRGATLIDSTAAGGSSSGPQVAVDANGNAVAVWPHSGTTGPNIWGNVFK